MHELSVAQNIIEVVRAEMSKAGAKKLNSIVLSVGPFAGINSDALTFGFQALTDNTDLEGAGLEIRNVTEDGICLDCNQEVEVDDPFIFCPVCGGIRIEIKNHHQMQIEEIEVD